MWLRIDTVYVERVRLWSLDRRGHPLRVNAARRQRVRGGNGLHFCETCPAHSNLGAPCALSESFCVELSQCGGVLSVCGRWTAAIHTCP